MRKKDFPQSPLLSSTLNLEENEKTPSDIQNESAFLDSSGFGIKNFFDEKSDFSSGLARLRKKIEKIF